MKKLLLITLLSLNTYFAARSTDDLLFPHSSKLIETDWQLVQDIFIEQPRNQVTTFFGEGGILAASSLAAGAGLAALWRHELSYLLARPAEGFRSNLAYIIAETLKPIGLTSALTAAATYLFLRQQFIRGAQEEQMDKVLNSWTDLRTKFPAKLHDAFDILSRLKKNGAAEYRTRRAETLRLLKDLLAKQFPTNKGLSINLDWK